jgi:hypothetical protein
MDQVQIPLGNMLKQAFNGVMDAAKQGTKRLAYGEENPNVIQLENGLLDSVGPIGVNLANLPMLIRDPKTPERLKSLAKFLVQKFPEASKLADKTVFVPWEEWKLYAKSHGLPTSAGGSYNPATNIARITEQPGINDSGLVNTIAHEAIAHPFQFRKGGAIEEGNNIEDWAHKFGDKVSELFRRSQ